jgi:hypothetical protein
VHESRSSSHTWVTTAAGDIVAATASRPRSQKICVLLAAAINRRIVVLPSPLVAHRPAEVSGHDLARLREHRMHRT